MLTDEQRAQGWKEHDGGPCPVALASKVEVMCRGGDTDTDFAHTWWWGRNKIGPSLNYEIIAYREVPHD